MNNCELNVFKNHKNILSPEKIAVDLGIDRENVPSLLTDVELAKILRLSRQTPRYWRVKGIGPRFILVGSSVRYAIDDIEEYLRSNRFNSTTEAGNNDV